jgi:hypothetical protein
VRLADGVELRAAAAIAGSGVDAQLTVEVRARNPAFRVGYVQYAGSNCHPRVRLYRSGESAVAWDSQYRPGPRWPTGKYAELVCVGSGIGVKIPARRTIRLPSLGLALPLAVIVGDSLAPAVYRVTAEVVLDDLAQTPVLLEAGSVALSRSP